MSAQSISRWSAIPLSLSEARGIPSGGPNKRSREDDYEGEDSIGDISEDDVSLVSRSSSPVQGAAMDVDGVSKYDEFVRGAPQEAITIETRIKSTNRGFALLAKLGWSEGQPLGLSGDGRVDPIPFSVKRDLTGLGKTSQDVRMIETTVSQRRGLDSERQRRETEEQRRAREDEVAHRVALKTEIAETLKAFYCQLCDKQFQNVAQYDEHTNSYAHAHKQRFKDMQASQKLKIGDQEEIDKRKAKEKKREEKELRKIAKAAGVKMPKPSLQSAPALITPEVIVPTPGAGEDPISQGSKKSAWAPVASSTPLTSFQPPVKAAAPGSPEYRKAGWANVESSDQQQQTRLLGGWSTAGDTTAGHSQSPYVATGASSMAFKTAGWTSLDTGTSVPPPPSTMIPKTGSGWTSVANPVQAQSRMGWSASSHPPSPSSESHSLPSPPPPPPTCYPPFFPRPPSPPTLPPPPPLANQSPPGRFDHPSPRTESRGWQSWQQGRNKPGYRK